MQTKVIDKIVLSESAPSNKNVAWLKPSTEGGGLSLKVYKDQEWSKVETTSSSEGDGGSTPDTPSGSSWRYFDTTKATVTEASLPFINLIFSVFKLYDGLYTFIICKTPTSEEWGKKVVSATATDFNLKIFPPEFTNGEIKTIGEMINDIGGIETLKEELGFTEITKEQFYSLD